MEITARVCTLGVDTRRLFYNVAVPCAAFLKNAFKFEPLESYFVYPAPFVFSLVMAAKAGFKVKYRSNTKTSSGCQMHEQLKINSTRARTTVL